MDNPLTLALTVSGIGLLILFAALAVLYGLMYAMTALIKDRPVEKQEEPAPAVETESASPAARRAAVIAVALARAELEQSSASAPPETGGSPWGQYHRRRLLDLNLRTRTGR